jgi:hypothetical protein
METNQEKTYKVLLEQMAPVYTLVTVTATGREEAAVKAQGKAEEEGHEWSHDRLPDEQTWSIIPPVDIAMPTEDGPPRVLGVWEGEVGGADLTCWGTSIVTSDGSIVRPHFVPGRQSLALSKPSREGQEA